MVLSKYFTVAAINRRRSCYCRCMKTFLDNMFLSKNKQFLNINISHGSLATHLRCGGMFHNDVIANLPLSLSVKEF